MPVMTLSVYSDIISLCHSTLKSERLYCHHPTTLSFPQEMQTFQSEISSKPPRISHGTKKLIFQENAMRWETFAITTWIRALLILPSDVRARITATVKTQLWKRKKEKMSLFIPHSSNPLPPAPVSNYRADFFFFISLVSLHRSRFK
jgi:hypothetical protein